MADLIILNAHIRSMDASDGEDYASASAVAVAEGRIIDLGADEEVRTLAHAGTTVIDAGSAVLTPGLIDSHMHPIWGAELSDGVNLGGLTELDDVRRAVAEAAASLPEGEWIRGWNLDYKAFPDGIDGSLFDGVAGTRPLFLLFYDLHTAVANAAALNAAGITGAEQFSDVSQVVLDNTGHPTGELREMPAYMLLLEAAPPKRRSVILDRIDSVLREAASSGVTSAAVMDGRDITLELVDAMEKRPRGLPLRLHIAMWHQPSDGDDLVDHRISLLGRQGDRYRVAMVKMFIDGVIDSGTAWLHEPDSDGESRQPFWKSLDRYADVTSAYHAAGFRVATHSCGDAGAAAAMDVYQTLEHLPDSASRHRVEHLETLTDRDVRRLAETQTIASMQPLHMQWRENDHSDPWATRLGRQRTERAFRTRDILDAGGHVCLGSDWPVADLDARVGMAWARLRRKPGRTEAPVFEPSQRLTGIQALLGYTRWAAEALGRSDLGRIVPGARADLTLWERDPVTADADTLPEIPVRLTTIDGTIIHHTEPGA